MHATQVHATRVLDLLYPLSEFYQQSGKPLPTVVRVEGRAVPEPYRSLLVHGNAMTSTLEAAYQRSVGLRVLESKLLGNVLARQVVLFLEGDAKAVEFGAIKIHLEHFPSHARQLVLEGKQPLGSILHSQGVERTGTPEHYIRVEADAVVSGALRLTKPCLLYGRRNTLVDFSQRILAEIVEILPPLNGFANKGKHREQI